LRNERKKNPPIPLSSGEIEIARAVRLMHREYGFTASQTLEMPEDELIFWLQALKEDDEDAAPREGTQSIQTGSWELG
jgi:hypothetical protein